MLDIAVAIYFENREPLRGIWKTPTTTESLADIEELLHNDLIAVDIEGITVIVYLRHVFYIALSKPDGD